MVILTVLIHAFFETKINVFFLLLKSKKKIERRNGSASITPLQPLTADFEFYCVIKFLNVSF